MPCIAKCWLASCMGPLTVYPSVGAMKEMYSASIGHPRSASWTTNERDLAFLLPVGCSRNPPRSTYRAFGQSPGPFMLRDSEDLAARVLERLGYLDDDLNSDFCEAALVFSNAAASKCSLRKLRLMVDGKSTPAVISRGLQTAFLSSRTIGQWQLAPSDAQVRKLLNNYLHARAAAKKRGAESHAGIMPRTTISHTWRPTAAGFGSWC